MSLDTLQAGYRKVLKHIYSRRHYYRRLKEFLSEYGVTKVDLPVTRGDFEAMGRSMLRLGVLGKERLEYRKLLLWTVLREAQTVFAGNHTVDHGLPLPADE